MGWVSPTGHNDPNGQWNNEANGYDGDTGTYTYDQIGRGVWTTYLELTHAALRCSKVRFYGYVNFTSMTDVWIDAYYSGAWHAIYHGAIPGSSGWNEYEIGSIQWVTKVRIQLCSKVEGEGELYAGFNECEFWEIPLASRPSLGSRLAACGLI